MDAVQKVGNGHPGTAMSLAPAAYLLFQKVMRHDPSDPRLDRPATASCCPAATPASRSTSSSTSAASASALDDLKALRTWGSRTPGHPEHGHTAGVETTTGPLGQGVGNAVGMAMAARRERGLLDPDAAAGESPFDHFVYAICQRRRPPGGRQRRGLLARRPPAARQPRADLRRQQDLDRGRHRDRVQRGRLRPLRAPTAGTCRTSTGPTAAPSTPRTSRRSGTPSSSAQTETDRPSFINLRTIIAWPAPNAQNTGKAARLRARRRRGRGHQEDAWASTPRRPSRSPTRSSRTPAACCERGSAAGAAWDEQFAAWAAANPERAELLAPDLSERRPPRRLDRRAADLRRRRQGRRHPQGLRRGAQRDRARCCPSCGAARPTWPSPTTRRPRASRRSCPPSTPPRSSPATRTAACCTSASASTPWAR